MTNRLKVRQRVTTPAQLLETIAARRRTLRLSQQQIAAKLGIHQTYLSGIEGGRRSLDVAKLLQLLNVLGLDLVIEERPAQPTKIEW